MALLRSLARGIRSLLRREQVERDLDEELRAYREMEMEERMGRGMSRDEASRSARLEGGDLEIAKEMVHTSGWEFRLEAWWRDLRFATRLLRKSPGFTGVAVATLALGIGAAASIFSVVEAVLLRPLPYREPERIVQVWEQTSDGHRMHLADPNFEDFRTQNRTFSSLAEYAWQLSSVSGGKEPVRMAIAAVSGGFFPALGVSPALGRGFVADEQREHGAPAAIVSYRYWQRYLGGAEDLSAFHLTMEGGVYPVVGVMPAGFDFPRGVAAWIPREAYPMLPSRTAHNFHGLGRLRDGVTVAQARADLSTIARHIKRQYGKDVDLDDAAVVPLGEAMVGDVRTALMTLSGAVGLLLLVACANVAGLLLARAAARRRELAVRAALGAGRGRLIQQFLTEAFVLALAGGGLGVLIAVWTVHLLPAVLPVSLPRAEGIAVNAPVLLFALAATLLVTFSLGLLAARHSGRIDLQETLSAGPRGGSATGSGQRLRRVLVIGEIAATLVILVGAALLGRSFLRLVSTDPGFSGSNLMTMELSPPPTGGEGAEAAAAYRRQITLLENVLARLRALPGVQSVGLAGSLPVAHGDDLADGQFLILNGRKPPANFEEWGAMARDSSRTGQACYAVAGAGYFRTLGIPLIRGRMFGEQDSSEAPHVAIISQSLARQRWPNQDPIGQIIDFGNMDGDLRPMTIIGVVGDVRARGLNLPPTPVIYVDYRQRGLNSSSIAIVLRRSATQGEPAAAARAIFGELAPDLPVKLSTFEQELGGWLADRRFLLVLVGLFAAAALVLAAVGIYGVVAYSVSRRTQEIGVRMALGAQGGDVLRMVTFEGARMAAFGVALGVAASMALTRLMSTLLFGISPTDPATLAGVALLLTGVALLASYLPARRATRVDPLAALRCE